MCFVSSKVPSHHDSSLKHPKHKFLLKKQNKIKLMIFDHPNYRLFKRIPPVPVILNNQGLTVWKYSWIFCHSHNHGLTAYAPLWWNSLHNVTKYVEHYWFNKNIYFYYICIYKVMKYRKIWIKYNAYFKKAVFHSRENIKGCISQTDVKM